MKRSQTQSSHQYTLDNPDVKSQIDYAVYKYGGNLPKSLARAKAEEIALKVLPKYDSSKGNIKTFLSKHLSGLSRQAYAASSILKLPENRLMQQEKVRSYSQEYFDTFGRKPSASDISSDLGIKKTDAEKHLSEIRDNKLESSFENISTQSSGMHMTPESIVDSVHPDLVNIARDIYIHGKKERDILRDNKLTRSTFFNRKRKIDSQIKENAGLANIKYR